MKLILIYLFTFLLAVNAGAQQFKKGDLLVSAGAGYFHGPLYENENGKTGFYLELETYLGKGWSLAPVLQYGEYKSNDPQNVNGYVFYADGFEYNFGLMFKKQILKSKFTGLQVGTGLLVNYYSDETITPLTGGFSVSSQEGRDLALPLNLEVTQKISNRFYIGIRSSVIYTGSNIFDAFNIMPGVKVKL